MAKISVEPIPQPDPPKAVTLVLTEEQARRLAFASWMEEGGKNVADRLHCQLERAGIKCPRNDDADLTEYSQWSAAFVDAGWGV